jgi:hypothetical protein
MLASSPESLATVGATVDGSAPGLAESYHGPSKARLARRCVVPRYVGLTARSVTYDAANWSRSFHCDRPGEVGSGRFLQFCRAGPSESAAVELSSRQQTRSRTQENRTRASASLPGTGSPTLP